MSNARELSENKVTNKFAKFMWLPVLEIFHAGLYVYNDFKVVGVSADWSIDCALRVLAWLHSCKTNTACWSLGGNMCGRKFIGAVVDCRKIKNKEVLVCTKF